MEFGCFGFIDNLEDIARAGYDQAELDICEIAALDGAAFESLRRRAADCGVGCRVFSGFLPLSLRFYEPGFDSARWLEHTRLCAARMAALGGKLMPIGAGKCRSIPEGGDERACRAFLLDFFGKVADIMAAEGIDLAIEPLGPANSNYLNTIPEAAAFARELAKTNFGTMCDMRHMHKLGEPLSDIALELELILHAHVDFPLGERRLFPSEDDGYDYAPYVDTLLACGYDRILSVEATCWDDFPTEAAGALALLKRLAG